MSDRSLLPSSAVTGIVVRFATEIQLGRRPSIEAALDQASPAEWPQLLQSLLIAEVNARRARGETPLAREYLPRFPAHTEIVRAVVPDHVPPPASGPCPPPLPPQAIALPESPAVLVTPEPAPFPAVLPPPGPPPRPRRRRLRAGILILTGTLVLGVSATAIVLGLRRSRPGEPPPAPPPPAPPAPLRKPMSPLAPKPAPADPERELADWARGLGGRGTVRLAGGGRLPFGPEEPLPKTSFSVTALSIPTEAAGRWEPADLKRLAGRDKLTAFEFHAAGPLTEADLAPLAGLPLRTLVLDGPTVRASGALFAGFPALETLVLAHSPEFADADLAALGKLPRLAALTVNSPKLTVAGFQQLQNPMLTSLTLGDRVALTPDVVRVLIRLPLQTFESRAGMTDDAFIEFAIFTDLRRIRLRYTRLTDAALRAVVGLGKLEELRIDGSAISGPGLEHLAERKGLRVLDLSGGKLSNEALGHLLALPALKELRLAGNPIDDNGAALLAQLDGLEVLDVGETAITDASLRTLTKHATLKTLIVTNTRVTAPGVRAFEAGTPGCKVIFGKRR